MEDSDIDAMTPFDKLISSDQLQMMKLMIPYTPLENQRMLAIYAKFLELEHTIDFFRHYNHDIHAQAFEKKLSSPADILDELRPFLPKQQRNFLDSVMNLFNIMEMAAAMKEMTTKDDGHPDSEEWNPLDMMKGMLTPEQQSMFEMYNTMLNHPENPDMKGETDNG